MLDGGCTDSEKVYVILDPLQHSFLQMRWLVDTIGRNIVLGNNNSTIVSNYSNDTQTTIITMLQQLLKHLPLLHFSCCSGSCNIVSIVKCKSRKTDTDTIRLVHPPPPPASIRCPLHHVCKFKCPKIQRNCKLCLYRCLDTSNMA